MPPAKKAAKRPAKKAAATRPAVSDGRDGPVLPTPSGAVHVDAGRPVVDDGGRPVVAGAAE